MSTTDNDYYIGFKQRSLSVNDELENLEKYVIHDDGVEDFDAVIWKWLTGFPITIVCWKERGKKYDEKHTHLVKGASALKAIKEFIGGRVANIMNMGVTWDFFNDEIKEHLLNGRYLNCLLVDCDKEVGDEIQNLL